MIERLGFPNAETDLTRFPFIESSGEIGHIPQTALLRNIMPPRNKSFCSNSILSQLEAFKAELGILALPNYLSVFLPDAIRILEDDFKPHADLRIMYHAPYKNKPGFRATLDALSADISKLLSVGKPSRS